MQSTLLFSHIRYLASPSIKCLVRLGSFQQQSLLHMSLPFMNKDGSSDKGNLSNKKDRSEEGPHMRSKSKPAAKNEDPQDYILHHPIYSKEEVNAIRITHKAFESWHDRVAYAAVRTLRFFVDTFTGYLHEPPSSKSNTDQSESQQSSAKYMTEKQWLRRIIFLESIAAVPGMVAGMSRHMRSLRTFRRDYGWIHLLLSEAENQRMHLLTFLELRKPGWIFREFILSSQGVFFNVFFATYLISPKICHRFVGFLEEEAVITYTRCLRDLDAGKLPKWSQTPAPNIAKTYWKLPDDAMLRDVLLAIRADEAIHRQVNHKLADVGPNAPNPFLDQQKDGRHPPNENEQREIDTYGKK